MVKSILLILFIIISCFSIHAQIIPINSAMVTNESGYGTAGNIADEQATAGDPLNSSGGNPTTEWHAGWTASNYPASVYINLGSITNLTHIYIYDNNGQDSLIIEYGSPGSWTYLTADELVNYQVWNAHPVSVSTQYLRFTLKSSAAHFNEIVLYGSTGSSSDSIAPSPITDLSVTGTTAQTISLSWTATGDDNGLGTATSYDLRRSTSPINTGNFNSATVITGVQSPSTAGTNENFVVTGLSAQTEYYFAIKALDEVPNTSTISNVESDSTDSISGGLPPLTKTYIHLPVMDPQWNTTPVYNALEPVDFDAHWAALLASLPAPNGSWNGGSINLGTNGTGWGDIQWNSASSTNKKPILVQLPSAGGSPGVGICPMDSRFIVCSAMNNSSGSVSGAAEYQIALLAIQQMIKNIQASGNATDDVFVIGKSQGGGTGMMTAALNEDVKDFFLSVPALSGYTGSGGTTGAFPGYASNNTNAYVDACNHAKRYRNKATFSISYNDAVTWGRGQVTDAKNTQFTTTVHHSNSGHSDTNWWGKGSDWLDSCLNNIVDNGVGLAGNTTNIQHIIPKANELNVYPNPVLDQLTYVFKIPTSGNIDISLYNTNGSMIFSEQQQLNTGGYRGTLNISHIPPGIYFLNIEGEYVYINKRIVVQ